MRVLVTGGNGFIGSHVVDKLKERDVTVRVFDLVPPRDPDVEHYAGSITDLSQVRASLSGVDAVIHLAAVADVGDVFKEPHYSEMVNSHGTATVLEAMRLVGVKRIVYGSTSWVYSDATETDVDESTPLNMPSHFYSATKLTGEMYCNSYAKMYDLEPTILRFGIPYGPRSRPAAVVPIFVNKALAGEALTIQGDGNQFRKFVYVEDLAEGIVKALRGAAIGGTFNLDGQQKVTIKEIAETVQNLIEGTEIKFVEARVGDFAGKEVSSDLAKKVLDWESKTPFIEGVRRYVEWIHSTRAATLEAQRHIHPDIKG